MAHRPQGVDPETWRQQRAVYWRRVNRVLNLLMLVAIGLLVARYFGWLPALG